MKSGATKPRTYMCSVTGFNYEGRADYILRHIQAGSSLQLIREPSNRYDRQAVAVYHNNHKIGYIPRRKGWVSASLDEGDEHDVKVFEVDVDEGDILGIYIQITIARDGPRRPPSFLTRLWRWLNQRQ